MTTKVPRPKVPRSPGTTRDILGCPTRHDYQSPTSKDSKKSWDNSGPGMSYKTGLPKSQVQKSQEVLGQLGTSQDVLADMTTKVPGLKVPKSPGNTRDIPRCPIRHDYQSPTSKDPKKSWDNSLPDMNSKVPHPKIPRSPRITRDIPGCPTRLDY